MSNLVSNLYLVSLAVAVVYWAPSLELQKGVITIMKYTNSLVNTNLVYANSTNMTFQKVSISNLICFMKFRLSETMTSGYS